MREIYLDIYTMYDHASSLFPCACQSIKAT